jgi:anti-anti-sigma factor
VASSTAGYKGGARTSLALLVHSAAIFAAVAALAPLLARLPLVVVGAVLVVTGLQLVDRWSLQLVRKVISRDTVDWHSTALDLTVILAVTVTAIAGDIAIAVLIGVGVAVVLFVLRMSRSIARREQYGDAVRSRRARAAAESALLDAHGCRIVLLELEGPVFFGSAESLAERVDAALTSGVRYVVLDFRRVNDLDSAGAGILLQTHERLKAQGVHLLLASVDAAPHVEAVLRGMGVVAAVGAAFADADHALEWAENHLVGTLRPAEAAGGEYPFEQLGLLKRFTAEERQQFRALLKRREYAAGEILFHEGAVGDGLYIIVSGSASAKLTVARGRARKARARAAPSELRRRHALWRDGAARSRGALGYRAGRRAPGLLRARPPGLRAPRAGHARDRHQAADQSRRRAFRTPAPVQPDAELARSTLNRQFMWPVNPHGAEDTRPGPQPRAMLPDPALTGWTRARASHIAAVLTSDLEQRRGDLAKGAAAHCVNQDGKDVFVLDHRLLQAL